MSYRSYVVSRLRKEPWPAGNLECYEISAKHAVNINKRASDGVDRERACVLWQFSSHRCISFIREGKSWTICVWSGSVQYGHLHLDWARWPCCWEGTFINRLFIYMTFIIFLADTVISGLSNGRWNIPTDTSTHWLNYTLSEIFMHIFSLKKKNPSRLAHILSSHIV